MFENWLGNNPDNGFRGIDEDCTHLVSVLLGTENDPVGRWNDLSCFVTEITGEDVGPNHSPNPLRPICKQEQTVWDHPYFTSAYF